jgi:hypothetical protein
LIDRDVERALAHDKAHRYEMRRCPRIGGREMTDPATGQKAGLMLGQHSGTFHDIDPCADLTGGLRCSAAKNSARFNFRGRRADTSGDAADGMRKNRN